jgi:hypothetical protein
MCNQQITSVNCDVCHQQYTTQTGRWGECIDHAQGKGCDGTRDDWTDTIGGTCGMCIIRIDKEVKRRRAQEETEPSDKRNGDATV